MKGCRTCTCPNGSCNWLDWMVEDNDGGCLHCGNKDLEQIDPAPMGRLLDRRPIIPSQN
jgi:hypothetical protein